MSGDVQPRKRKDRRRKRDGERRSEGEVTFSRQSSFQDDDESSHGVHSTKMSGEDVHLHVQHEHGTGGHWCAKILFFSLLAILLGLVALIIMENRGLSDLDTPLSESRFSNYFDGWVEENRAEHDEHDAVQASIEEHDEHDEPFDEEEDHSEVDDEDHDEEDDEEEEEEEEEHDNEPDNDNDDEEGEDNDDENETVEATTTREEETREDDDNDDDVDNDEDNDDDNDAAEEEEEDNDDDDEKQTVEDNDNEDNTNEETNDNDNDNDENNTNEDDTNDDDNDDDDDDEEPIKPIYSRQTHQDPSSQHHSNTNDDNDDDPFDEEEDDGTFESLENVVDNDAEELLLLQEKARQQQAEAAKNVPNSAENDEDDLADSAPSWASSLAVKIGVGVALAIVARLVLIRKSPNTNEETVPENIMKRRLTIATALDTFPEDEDENVPILPDDEYSEEEVEIEEEIEYVDEEEDMEPEENDGEMTIIGKYVPETFESLNAMYRSKDRQSRTPSPSPSDDQIEVIQNDEIPTQTLIGNTQISNNPPDMFTVPQTSSLLDDEPDSIQLTTTTSLSVKMDAKKPDASEISLNRTTIKREVSHDEDVDSPPDVDIDYDHDNYDNDNYDDDEEEEDEEDDDDDIEYDEDNDDDISDIDDTELMSRLEAKYGRLPAKEYESDEDPDDPTWTQIKPKQNLGGGPEAHAHDDDDEIAYDLFERELRRANEEMMRENYPAALNAFSQLSHKYPDKPQAFLGKANCLDHLSEQQRSNHLLIEALEAFKRYLAFGNIIIDDLEYRTTAERCLERMHFMGYYMQSLPIHEQLIERFNNEAKLRNQLAVTYLMLNRLSDAKAVLQETLLHWPADGFAQVHYGFILKQLDGDYENAIVYLKRGIETKAEGTQDGRYFFHLGEALQRLGRQAEALDVYKRGAELKLFPSVYQRSLYNEPNLRAQAFWTKEETTYEVFFNKLENNWRAIRDEGLSVLSKRGYFLDEAENLRDSGDWKQFELYARGQRQHKNCLKAPITCGIIAEFKAASSCRRGQMKFSVMHAGTHVYTHCGPTNCRLRAHLGLVVPPGPKLRVANETRTWRAGEILIFDDSFEHEVWHNGSSLRLVLIVDVWHPDLSESQRRILTPI